MRENYEMEAENLLSCFYFNARSIKNKLYHLHFEIYGDKAPDIIFICESWLNSTVTNAMIDPQSNFSIYRYDRVTSEGGGVAVLIKNRLGSIQFDLYQNFPEVEGICFDLLGDFKLRFIIIYRPPSRGHGEVNVMTQICNCIKSCCIENVTTVVLGDFNCSGIDWHNSTSGVMNELLFLDTIINLGFQQFVDKPTRGENILDIVLCNDPMLISDIVISEPFSTSDHASLRFVLNQKKLVYDISAKSAMRSKTTNTSNIDTNRYTNPLMSVNWNRTNWDSLSTFIAHYDWNLCFSNPYDSNACWNVFLAVLQFAILWFVPKYKSVRRNEKSQVLKNKTNKKKLYPISVRKEFRIKAAAWRKYRKYKNNKCKTAYMRAAKRCKTAVYKHSYNVERQILSSGDLGKFYRFVNSKLSCKTGIAPLIDPDGNYVFDNYCKANLLNNYFASVCTKDNNVPPDYMSASTNNRLSTVEFNCSDMFNCLKKLKSSLSSGPDGIPPLFLKKLAVCLTIPLCMLCNCIFKSENLPDM